MYKYYGAPAVAFWGGGLAGCHSNGGEASQAPDDSAAQVVQAITCEVCKMQFINLDHLRSHETGKEHKKNLEKLQESITSEPAKPPNGAVEASTESAAAASVVADGMIPAVQPKKNKSSPANPEDLEVNKRRVLEAGAAQGEVNICMKSNVVKKMRKVVQPVTCEVCKMQFNSLHDLRGHETGKKHKKNLWKNLKKLQDSMTPKQENPLNGAVGASTAPAAAVTDAVMPAVQPEKNKSSAATPEDLEVKKRRVLEAGAAQGELKICTMSSVVRKTPKVVEPATCEVCEMQCNSLNSLRAHETGKKHRKNLEKLQEPEPAKPPNNAVGEPAAAAVADGVIPGVQPKKNKRPTATAEDLEVKRRRVLEHGVAEGEVKTCTMSNVVKKMPKVVQPVTCEVCKMQFNCLHDLRGHETGKKHKKNLEKLQDSTTPETAKPPNDAVGASTEPAAAVADTVMPAVQPKKNESSTATPEDLEVKKRRVLEAGAAQGELEICTMSNAVKKIPKVVQPVTCEVCKMQFNSLYNLRDHETGKKHRKNLEKLQDSITPEPAKPPNDAVGASTEPAAVADGVPPAVQPKKNKRPASTPEDLEAKRRRVVEHGAAEGEVKICTTCNVVANCQKDHEVHIAGHKHNAKLQRQQQVQ